MNTTILLAGSGKLAVSIKKGLPGHLPDYHIDTWEHHTAYGPHELIVVHIGSGRQIEEVCNFCRNNSVPLIQGSTGMNIDEKDCTYTFIDAPNLSILMVKFMYMLKQFGSMYKKYSISITESHQHTKKSVPGTAVEIADSLGVNSADITSIRNQKDQEHTYGIPGDFLSLHAYHDICIQEESTRINFKTLVKGHDSYVSGLAAILQCVHHLEKRYYHIVELIESKMI